MAYTVAFSTSQVAGAPSEIVITDASTGSDGTVSTRRIHLTNSAGQYIDANGVSDSITYTDWPLAAGSSKTLAFLTKDMALNVTLSYVTSGGAVANGATLTTLCGFTLYNESFYYTLTQAQASQSQPPPMIIQDSNYYMNKLILRVNIDSGNQSISLGDDITSAQNMYDLATYMVTNEGDYF